VGVPSPSLTDREVADVGSARTLLQIAGEAPAPSGLGEACVVVIDAQRVYLDRGLPLDGTGPALDALRRLLARAREAGAPIVHVVHDDDPGGMFDPADGGRIIDAAARSRTSPWCGSARSARSATRTWTRSSPRDADRG
jgi:hypothetical protein